MNSKFKKGQILRVEHKTKDGVVISIGVLFKINKKEEEIELVHNFSELKPIDRTIILLNSIDSYEEVSDIIEV